MSSPEVRYKLKRPVMVYFLAFCFTGAPLGNIFASMISFGIVHWYYPSTFITFLGHIAWVDRVWLALTMAAGIALLNQRKSTWLFAIGALCIASAFNIYYSLRFSSTLTKNAHFFPILFTLSNFGVIATLYHFRFPYLDRREAWWGSAPRFSCKISVNAPGISGVITNISRTGAYFQSSGKPLKTGDRFQFQIGNISGLEGEVVHSSEKGCGIEFNPNPQQKSELKRFVSEIATVPASEAAPKSA